MIEILLEGITVTLVISGIVLGSTLVVGLLCSIAQTATQVQEQTITLVCKWITTVIIFLILGSWMGETLIELFQKSLEIKMRL